MKTTVQVLTKARALIKHGWCREYVAVTRAGDCVIPPSRGAVKFCPIGAIMQAGGAAFGVERQFFRRAIGGETIAEWNDAQSRRKRDVLAAFDRAIKLARADARGKK